MHKHLLITVVQDDSTSISQCPAHITDFDVATIAREVALSILSSGNDLDGIERQLTGDADLQKSGDFKELVELEAFSGNEQPFCCKNSSFRASLQKLCIMM